MVGVLPSSHVFSKGMTVLEHGTMYEMGSEMMYTVSAMKAAPMETMSVGVMGKRGRFRGF